jgi:dynactin-6
MPLDPTGTAEETLQPYAVIFGAESSRRIWDGSNQAAEKALREKHIEYVREIMPK